MWISCLLPDHPVHDEHVPQQSHHTDEGVQGRDAHGDDDTWSVPGCSPVGPVAPGGQQQQQFLGGGCDIDGSSWHRVALAEKPQVVGQKSGELHGLISLQKKNGKWEVRGFKRRRTRAHGNWKGN